MDRFDGDEDSSECKVYHDHDPEIDHGHIELVGSAWSIAKSQNEARNEGCQV